MGEIWVEVVGLHMARRILGKRGQLDAVVGMGANATSMQVNNVYALVMYMGLGVS